MGRQPDPMTIRTAAGLYLMHLRQYIGIMLPVIGIVFSVAAKSTNSTHIDLFPFCCGGAGHALRRAC